MKIDLTIGILDLIQFMVFLVAAGTFYFKGIRKFATWDASAKNFDTFATTINNMLETFKSDVKTEFKALKESVTNSLTFYQQNLNSMERRYESLDEKYVRKDVHDANLALINERLKPMENLNKLVTKLLTENQEPTTKKKKGVR